MIKHMITIILLLSSINVSANDRDKDPKPKKGFDYKKLNKAHKKYKNYYKHCRGAQ